jgi:hypothetical protein
LTRFARSEISDDISMIRTTAAFFSTRTMFTGEARRSRCWMRLPGIGSISCISPTCHPDRAGTRRTDGRLPPGAGAGPLRDIVTRVLDKGYVGYFVVEVLRQTLWRDAPLAVARRCHAGAVKVLEPV